MRSRLGDEMGTFLVQFALAGADGVQHYALLLWCVLMSVRACARKSLHLLCVTLVLVGTDWVLRSTVCDAVRFVRVAVIIHV